MVTMDSSILVLCFGSVFGIVLSFLTIHRLSIRKAWNC